MKLSFTIIGLFICCYLNAQKAGTLDSSFGINGILLEKRFQAYSVHIAPQKEDKFIATGSVNPAKGFLLTRYNSKGFIDSTFGNNGNTLTIFPLGIAYCLSVKTNDKDEIFAAGNINEQGYSHLGLAKYYANGLPDTTFGKMGIIDFNIDEKTSTYVEDICVQPDNKIIVAAYTQKSFSDYTNVIFRFNDDGSLDNGFGNNGIVKSVLTFVSGSAYLVMQNDGKFLIGGKSPSTILIARYNINGVLDTKFGNDGIALNTSLTKNRSIGSLALEKNGNIIAGGEEVEVNKTPRMLLLRFTSEGLPDSTFGNAGVSTTQFNDESTINKVLVQNDGQIITAGSFLTGTQSYIVAKYFQNGKLDSTFGSQGVTFTSIRDQDACFDALLQSGNKILVAGVSVKKANESTSNYSFTQYKNDLSKKQIIIKKIRHYAATHNNAQAVSLNNVYIYPNPVQNVLHVAGLLSKAKLTVVDVAGNVRLQAVANSSSYNLNITSLTAGNYLLKIEMNNAVVTKQFIKQ